MKQHSQIPFLEEKSQAGESVIPELPAELLLRLDGAFRLSSVYGGSDSDGVELLVNARSRRRRSTEVKLGCRLTGLPRLPLICSSLVDAVEHVYETGMKIYEVEVGTHPQTNL